MLLAIVNLTLSDSNVPRYLLGIGEIAPPTLIGVWKGKKIKKYSNFQALTGETGSLIHE
jgi:hypothetical protein